MKKLKIGSRDSQLAVIQTRIVMDALQKAYPELELELVTMKTTGDKILNKTLDQVGGKGLFVKELDEALTKGLVDLTVHSAKDLPAQLSEDLPIVALMAREDPRDVLITGGDPQAPVGTSSKRRSLFYQKMYPEATVSPVRGNVQTRLRKLDEGQYSALIMAAAGLKRLGLTERINRYFETDEMLPAACQGILAVQGRRGDDLSFLKAIDHPETWPLFEAERAFITAIDGGCSSASGAYAHYLSADTLELTGMLEGKVMSLTGPVREAAVLGQALAARFGERKA